MVKLRLAIVILSYNTRKLLKECLQSLEKQITPKDNLEIVVVDNGSTDGSREYLKKLKIKSEKLRVIFNDRNLGFCEGNNIGLRYALKNGADYAMLLNSDTLIKTRFWEKLIAFLEKNHSVGIAAPKIYFAPGREYHQKKYQKKERGKVIWSVGGIMDWKNIIGSNRGVDQVDKGQFEKTAEADFVSGCCLLARREVWEKAGFLDKKYFMYYEDADFCQKAKKLGWKIYYVPDSCFWHANAGSSRVGGALQDYFISRNRLLFGFRHASWRAKIALFKESIRFLFKAREWQKKGIRDYYLGKFGKGSWQ